VPLQGPIPTTPQTAMDGARSFQNDSAGRCRFPLPALRLMHLLCQNIVKQPRMNRSPRGNCWKKG
jgi:hypothetical protein